MARASESLGFDAFFRSDHFLSMGDVSGLPGPSDAWTTLAGIARDTTTIRLGTLVTSATFRLPGPLAITVAGVDAMSGGRVELGLGAGWYESEHTAYGIPFPPVVERFERLEEQLALITGLWGTPDGVHLHLGGPPLPGGGQPGPAQAGAAARAADHRGRARRQAHAPAGRHLRRRVQPGLLVPGGDRHPVRTGPSRRASPRAGTPPRWPTRRPRSSAAAGPKPRWRPGPGPSAARSDELRTNGLCGSPDEVVAKLATYAGVGADRVYLQILDLGDLDHLALIAEEVLPHCASL